MTRIGRLRDLSTLAGLGVLILLLGVWAWRGGLFGDLLRPMGAEEVQSVAYALERERWTRFDIATPRGLVRVISNAQVNPTLPEAAVSNAPVTYSYALEYRIEEAGGAVLDEGIHYQRASMMVVAHPETDAPQPASWFADSGLAAAGAQRLHFDFGAGAQRRTILSLRLAAADAGVAGVAVRVYGHDRVAEEQLANRWLRLSLAQQEALAEDTVFPPELLEESEKLNLIRNRWKPVGPEGVEGDDYQGRRLHSFGAAELEYVSEPVLPFGVYLDGARRAVLPVAPGEGPIELRFEAPAGGAAAKPIEVRWQGADGLQRKQLRIENLSRPLSWRGEFGAGLLEIEAAEPLVVRAFRHAPGVAVVELTPPPQYLRLYRLDPAQPLQYRIDHAGGQPTPLRLDLRTAGLQGLGAPVAAVVSYALLDARGQVLTQGELQTLPLLSLYDRPSAALTSGWASEPATHYFRLSTAVHTLRLSSTAGVICPPGRAKCSLRSLEKEQRSPALAHGAAQEVWATASTRVADLPYRVDTARDYAPWVPQDERLPQWFLTRPVETEIAPDERATLLLDRQQRPAADDTALALGDYDWEWLRPVGLWSSREILAPLPPGQLIRAEARASIYRPLPVGRDSMFEFTGEPGRARLTPHLLYLRDDHAPFSFKLWLDGQLVLQRQLAGAQGEVRLPELAAGPHRLRVEAATPVHWLVNFAGAGADAYLQRQALRLNRNQPLRFQYEKRTAGRETFSARVFLSSAQASARLRIRVSGVGAATNRPSPGMTPSERVYEISAPPGEAAYVLQAAQRKVSGGAPLFVVLGEDLPPGIYPIEVNLEQSEEVYAQFYRLLPGVTEQRDIIRYQTGEEG